MNRVLMLPHTHYTHTWGMKKQLSVENANTLGSLLCPESTGNPEEPKNCEICCNSKKSLFIVSSSNLVRLPRTHCVNAGK